MIGIRERPWGFNPMTVIGFGGGACLLAIAVAVWQPGLLLPVTGLALLVDLALVLNVVLPADARYVPLLGLVTVASLAPTAGAISVVAGRVTLTDILLGLVLIQTIGWWRAGGRDVASMPAQLLVLYWGISVLLALAQGINTKNVLLDARPLAYFAVAIAVAGCPGAARATRILFGGLCLAAAVAAAKAIATAALFSRLAASNGSQGRVAAVIRLGNVVRVVAGSDWAQAGFAMLFPLLVLVRRRRRRAEVAVLLALTAGGVVVSYTRTVWLSVLAGVIAILPLMGFSWFKGWARVLALAALVGGLTLVIAPQALNAISGGVGDRLDQRNAFVSLQDRTLEVGPAVSAFASDPIFGAGLGTQIARVRESLSLPSVSTGFLHNGYLFLLAKQGILGLLVFLAAVGTALLRAYRVARSDAPLAARAMAIAAFAGLVSLLVSNYSAPFSTEEVDGVVLTALLIGLCDRLYWEAGLKLPRHSPSPALAFGAPASRFRNWLSGARTGP